MNTHYGSKLIYSGLAIILINLQQFLLLPIITQNLGVEQYGIWTQILTAVNLIVPLALLGLPNAFVRYSSGNKDRSSIASNYYTILALIVIACIIFSLIYFLAGDFIIINFIKTDEDITNIIRLSALLILVKGISQYTISYFRTFQLEKLYSFFQVLYSLVTLVAILTVVVLGFGLYEIIYSILIVDCILILITQIIIFKKIGFESPNKKLIKTLLLFSLPLLPVSISNWVISASDRYVIGYFLPVTEVAVYAGAYTLSMFVQFIYAPFYAFLFPKVSELWVSKDYYTLQKVFYYSNKVPLIFSIPIILFWGIFGSDTLSIITGARVLVPIGLILIISSGYIFYYIAHYHIQVIMLAEKTTITMYSSIICAIINIIGNIILVPLWGITGAAFVTLLTFFLLMVYVRHKAKKLFIINFQWIFLLKTFAASILMSLIVLWIRYTFYTNIDIYNLSFMFFIGGFTYIIFILIFRVFKKEDIDLIKSFIKAK